MALVIQATRLPDVLVADLKVFADKRGCFMESHHQAKYAAHGIPGPFVQDNLVRSVRNVLRGLHYQLPFGQGKLVHVVRGEIWDVAADIRRGSPSFGRWVGVTLSDRNRRQIYVPPGFAHGYCVISGVADVCYKCTDFYHPEADHGIRWDDPDLAVDWPVPEPLLSTKDAAHPPLRDTPPDTLPAYVPPSESAAP
jgi:dTDP-4-dehydrorhamnose 3,5-epimerase